MPASFVVEKSKNGKVKFNLRAGNSQVILTSELYEAKESAATGIESVRANAADPARFTIKKAKDGSAYFVLTATNGQTIGKSEMYKTEAAMRNGIKSVQTNAPTAKVIDKT